MDVASPIVGKFDETRPRSTHASLLRYKRFYDIKAETLRKDEYVEVRVHDVLCCAAFLVLIGSTAPHANPGNSRGRLVPHPPARGYHDEAHTVRSELEQRKEGGEWLLDAEYARVRPLPMYLYILPRPNHTPLDCNRLYTSRCLFPPFSRIIIIGK